MHSEPSKLSLLPKIMELEQALFFNFSPAVLRLPTSIINALHVDQVNQVWFLLRRPAQNLSEFDREFRARLEFYKKGKNFHMHVSGKACLVTDPEEINNAYLPSEEIRLQAASSMILVKMKIDHVNYYPHPVQRERASRISRPSLQPSNFIKTLQYIVKDIIPVFQSH